MPINLRLSCLHATAVVPEPRKGSRIISSSKDNKSTNAKGNLSGNTAGQFLLNVVPKLYIPLTPKINFF